MYCPSCGQANADTSRFCLKCGGALAEATVGPNLPAPIRRPIPPAARPAPRASDLGKFMPAIVIAVVVLVVLAGGTAGYGRWHAARQESAYNAGGAATAAGDWERTVADFQTAGDYLDAPQRLAQARQQVSQVLPLYTRAQTYRQKVQWWGAAFNLRQVVNTAPQFRDAAAQLADARGKIGSLVYATASNGRQTLSLAAADGGDGSNLTTSVSPQFLGLVGRSEQSILIETADGQTQALSLVGAKGGDRHELASGTAILSPAMSGGIPFVSSDRRRIAYSVKSGAATSFFVADVDTAVQRQIATSTDADGGSLVADLAPDFSKALLVTGGAAMAQADVAVSIVNVETGERQQLRPERIAARPGNAGAYDWQRLSPDGTRVLTFLARFDQQSGKLGDAISLIDVPTGKQLDLGIAQDAYGYFSGDGKHPLLMRQRLDDASWEAVLVDVLAGAQRTLLTTTDHPYASFLPGTSLATIQSVGQQGQKVFIVDVAGGAIQELAEGTESAIRYDQPSRRLLLWQLAPGSATGSLTVVDPLTLKKSPLPIPAANASSIFSVFSPDGKRLAVVAHDARQPNPAGLALIVMAPDGSNPVQVATAANISNVFFSPDGEYVAYSSEPSETAAPGVYVARADGSGGQAIVNNGLLVAWLPLPAGSSAASAASSPARQ